MVKNIGRLKPCHVFFKQPSENVFVFRLKDCQAQIHDMPIDEDPLGKVKFIRFFKVTVLNLYVIMTRQEIKLILLRCYVF